MGAESLSATGAALDLGEEKRAAGQGGLQKEPDGHRHKGGQSSWPGRECGSLWLTNSKSRCGGLGQSPGRLRQPHDDVAVALARAAHGAEPVDEAPLEPNVIVTVGRTLLLDAEARGEGRWRAPRKPPR